MPIIASGSGRSELEGHSRNAKFGRLIMFSRLEFQTHTLFQLGLVVFRYLQIIQTAFVTESRARGRM